jgi:methylglyoxal synthase
MATKTKARIKPANQPDKYGRVAFITTPIYRQDYKQKAMEFVCRNMDFLCRSFDVIATGTTYDFIEDNILHKTMQQFKKYGYLQKIQIMSHQKVKTSADFNKWKDTIRAGLIRKNPSFKGMIEIICELVEGRLDAVIHLKDWQDIAAMPDSVVLSREANVHNVPIATNVATAEAFIKTWKSKIPQLLTVSSIFPKRVSVVDLSIISQMKNSKVIALIAHDNMKLEMCRFVVENAKLIFSKYNWVIATGTTGEWIKRFVEAINGPDSANNVYCCYSGPKGGDLQIAYAVVQGWCEKIIFFQDPLVSHPHESDIHLFEQAVVADEVNVQMATNSESAKLII